MLDQTQDYDTANIAHARLARRHSLLTQVSTMLAKLGEIAGSADLDDEDRSIVLGVVDGTGERVLWMHRDNIREEERARKATVDVAAEASASAAA